MEKRNFLNDAYSASGTGAKSLAKAITDFAGSTKLEEINPADLTIFSIVSPSRTEDKLPVLKIKPREVTPSILTPRERKDIYFSPAKGTMGMISKKSLEGLGITEDLQDEMLDEGFFLMYSKDGKTTTYLAAGDFMATLCKRLGVGKVEPGVNPWRDMYLASLMCDAAPIQVLHRDLYEKGRHFGKMFSAFAADYVTETHEVLQDMRRAVSGRFGKAETGEWRISHNVSRCDYILDSRNLLGVPVEKGLRFMFSDIGDCSYKLLPILKVGGCASYLGEPSSQKHLPTGFSPEALMDGLDMSNYEKVDEAFRDMVVPVKSVNKAVESLIYKTKANAAIGSIATAYIKDHYLDGEAGGEEAEPEEEGASPFERDGMDRSAIACGQRQTFLDAALEFLQISSLKKGTKEYAKDRLAYATGSFIKVYKKVLEEESA